MYFPECPADLWRVVHHNCQQPYIVHRDLWSCWGFHHATRRQSKQCPTLVLGIFKNVHHGSGKIEMPLRCQRILKTIWWGKFGLGMWWNLVYFFFFERQCWEGGQSIRRFICILCMLLDPFFKRWIRNSCWTRICSSKMPVSPFKEAVGSTLLKVQVKPMFSHNCFHGLSQCQASTSSCVQEIFPGPQKAGWSQEDKHRVFWWNM